MDSLFANEFRKEVQIMIVSQVGPSVISRTRDRRDLAIEPRLVNLRTLNTRLVS